LDHCISLKANYQQLVGRVVHLAGHGKQVYSVASVMSLTPAGGNVLSLAKLGALSTSLNLNYQQLVEDHKVNH